MSDECWAWYSWARYFFKTCLGKIFPPWRTDGSSLYFWRWSRITPNWTCSLFIPLLLSLSSSACGCWGHMTFWPLLLSRLNTDCVLTHFGCWIWTMVFSKPEVYIHNPMSRLFLVFREAPFWNVNLPPISDVSCVVLLPAALSRLWAPRQMDRHTQRY